MSKLPKGPWTVTHNSWEISTVYDANGETVCQVPISDDVTEETQEHYEEITEAKAEAIGALPDLISAAQWIIQIEDGPWIASEWVAAKNALRSALQKANGGGE